MNPQELRIGNRILTPDGEKRVFMVIMQEGKWGVLAHKNQFDSSIGEWYPMDKIDRVIPNAENLDDAKFHKFSNEFENYSIRITNYPDAEDNQDLIVCIQSPNSIELAVGGIERYGAFGFHDIQNLYYSLTGKEL